MTIQSSSPWGKNKEMSATCRIQGFVEPESLRQLIRNECPVRRKSPVLQGREKWQHPSCCYNSGNIQNGKEIQAGVFQKCEQLKHMSARWAVHPCHVCSGGSWENPPGPGTIKSLAWPAAKRELLQVHLGTPPPHTFASRNFSCALDGSSFDTEDEWVAMLNCAAPRSKFLLIILSIFLSRCSPRLTFKSIEREFKDLRTGCLSPTQTRNQQSVTKPRDTKTCLPPEKLSR